jgi:DNA processing protein
MVSMEEVLLYFSLLHRGDWFKIFNSIKNKDKFDKEKFSQLKLSIKSNYVTILSSNYPTPFRNLEQPPYVIYYQGNYALINHLNKIAVVGSRLSSDYGADVTKKLTTDLIKQNYLIVSGLAKGIDAVAQQAAINLDGLTIGIVGQGIDLPYPKENSDLYQQVIKKGLILSEYPDGVGPSKINFPSRNRLIASISVGIVITEAKINSGTLTTVRHGLNYGKDIFCVPYPIGESSACNILIKQGAKLIESANDIIEEL